MSYSNKANERAVNIGTAYRSVALRDAIRPLLYEALQGDAMFRVFSKTEERALMVALDTVCCMVYQECDQQAERINDHV